MARVNWQGTEIEATLIDQLPNGNYKMRSKGHAHRIEPGTVIEVTQSQIVGLSIGGVNFNGPGAAAQLAGQQSGQTSTSVIPSTARVFAANDAASNPMPLQQGQAASNPMPPQGPAAIADLSPPLQSGAILQVSQPVAPAAPIPAPSRTTMANTPKLNGLMGSFDAFTARVEAAAEAVQKRLDAVGTQAETSTAKLSKAVDPIEAMVKKIDDTANQLTNGGPPLAP